MTAPTYDTLTTDDTGADKILTTGTVTALDQNPVSIAQRGTSAPRVQVPVREYLTSGSGATWNIPTGVTAFTVYIIGGGGEGDGAAPGGNGGASSVTYNSVTYTANGGNGAASSLGGSGGTASGGDLNVTGAFGHNADSGVQPGRGAAAPLFGGQSYGAGGAGAGNANGGGGSGALCVKRIVVVAGQTSATYTVGAGGTGGTGGNGDGGLIVIEY